MTLDFRRFVHWAYAERVRGLTGKVRAEVDAMLNAVPITAVRAAVATPSPPGQVPAFMRGAGANASGWAAMARRGS